MKIILTSEVKVGKSTVMNTFRTSYQGAMTGIICHAIWSTDGHRDGFIAENLKGEKKLFAHKSIIKSDFVVKNKFFVDISVIDDFIVPELRKGLEDTEKLVLVDEIGRMQSFSSLFMKTIYDLLESNVQLLGSVVFDPEPWSMEFKTHPEVILITVTESNRTELPGLLHLIFSKRNVFDRLNKNQRHIARELLRKYFLHDEFTQIKKLTGNAIQYVKENRITKNNSDFLVLGKNREHTVSLRMNKYLCDCDLFNGRGKYIGQPGECSHIQAIQIGMTYNTTT